MRSTILALLLTLLAPAFALADEPEKSSFVSLTADAELRAAVSHRDELVANGVITKYKATYLKYFTTYAVPVKVGNAPMRQYTEQSLQFVLNSTAHFERWDGKIRHAKQVPDHPTLWYIDIQDFGWDLKQWEVVADLDPYFKEPLVDSKVYNYSRTAGGNMLFRADWFIVQVTDVTKQDDRGEKRILYYVLIYGEGNEPKNAADFQKFWQVDIKTIRVQQLERGTIVDAGDSGVSQHTRQLRRARTLYGYYWETRDVKSHDIDPDKKQTRDFIEDIFASIFDASELIASNKGGLQVYLLTAGVKDKFKEVKFGDPTIVVDRSDQHDPRVRTGKSCIVCHPLGINPATNAIAEVFQKGGKLYAKYDDLKRQIESFYLDKRFDKLIEQDNALFEAAVFECNGLDPVKNAKAYVEVYEWYTAKVTLEQASFECGMEPKMFREEIKVGVTGRIVRLHQGKSVPREVWDSVNVGVYTQALLLIRRIKVQPADPKNGIEAKPKEQIKIEVTADWGEVKEGEKTLVYLPKGTVETVLEVNGDWYFVDHKGKYPGRGYIARKDVKVIVQ